MKTINQTVELLQITELKIIELAGRTCYQSQGKITENSHKDFIKFIISKGHESVLEHGIATFRWITSRSVTHELVRHRIASYSQESQRYVKYSNIEFINPVDREFTQQELDNLENVESLYTYLIKSKATPQQAREILPNCTKTEIIFTMNFRELRHFLKLRCSKSAHPQIRDLALKTLAICMDYSEDMFEDIGCKGE